MRNLHHWSKSYMTIWHWSLALLTMKTVTKCKTFCIWISWLKLSYPKYSWAVCAIYLGLALLWIRCFPKEQGTHNITLWNVCVRNNTFTFYCCWCKCSCQQYESVKCCHINATVDSLCTGVELQNILHCC
jgi:hypothetical protein